MRTDHALTAIKTAHTLVWLSIESCVAYLLYAGLTRRSDRRAALAGAVVVGECAVFAANGLRCPLTDVAESLGAEHGSVTDIYLPTWFARNLPAIHVPLLALIVVLHRRNRRGRRTPTRPRSSCTVPSTSPKQEPNRALGYQADRPGHAGRPGGRRRLGVARGR